MADAVAIRLRAARPSDCERVWRINNEETARAASRVPAPIPFLEHIAWFNHRLGDPDTVLDIIEIGARRPVGVLRLERHGAAAELSLAIDPAERGRGVGAAAVRAAAEAAAARWPDAPVEAWVADDNQASIRCFESAGFEVTGRESLDGRWFRRYQHRPEGAAP